MTGFATNRTVISGLRYPIPAAAACGLWALSRFVYTVRYGAGDPMKVCFVLDVALANKSKLLLPIQRILPVRIGFLLQTGERVRRLS